MNPKMIMIALTAVMTAAVPAHAQSGGMVVMRTLVPPAIIGPRRSLAPVLAPLDQGEWTFSDPIVQPGCTYASPVTKNVWCANRLGTVLADGACKGVKPTPSTTTPNFSTCTYSWEKGQWGNWSSYCSEKATRTRTDLCLRSSGPYEYVSRSQCNQSQPHDATEEAVLLTSCTYKATYSDTYSNCVANSQTAPITKCERSDGKVVANSFCPPQSPARYCASSNPGSCGPFYSGQTLTSVDKTRTSYVAKLMSGSGSTEKMQNAYKFCNEVESPNQATPYRRLCLILNGYDYYPSSPSVRVEVYFSNSTGAVLPGAQYTRTTYGVMGQCTD